MQIKDKIRLIRIEKGFSQENVAECLAIDTTNYGRIERGEGNITLDRLEKIATLFSMTLIEIVAYIRDETLPTANDEKDEEIRFLREQLQKKDQHIDRILDLSEGYRKEKERLEIILDTKTTEN
jgi:transcriptional regulator with XRE-family HTH domain